MCRLIVKVQNRGQQWLPIALKFLLEILLELNCSDILVSCNKKRRGIGAQISNSRAGVH
jgi:hypothetical protein